ncbi:tripartite tricarboxylate transporter substrate binding protein [Puniceibacterium sp. IMCC21224]|uniref:Bug family tripartite tricarboxylate transporter substrate binding protein n=1 Tax=Puniceibacterium sp. IMCC21224 TaxID=1618204 RepID=UPI00064DD2C0|nr:tripartite tricarboxylate transporter substrate-binding protein [Puniceibacterium sp. IMCC21224]KMK65511.1 hypothetical protein IMCC21224_11343 [Puniceibacterium sp. IMCC21224]
MTYTRRRMLAYGVAAGASAMAPSLATGQEAVSFEGKTIEWTIPFGEGGGSDTWARFFSTYLGKYLPGSPNVIVRNVPGGGSISGANAFAQRAAADGTAMLGVSGSTQFPYLLGDKRVQYDYRDLVPVLASPTGAVIYIPASFGIENLSQIGKLKDQALIFPNTGPTSLDLVMILAFDMLGLDVKHVFGMNSRGETRLAFERGEANIDFQTSASYLTNIQPMVDAGTAVPLFTVGALDEDGNVVRDPTFPDIPHFLEAYEAMHGMLPEKSEKFEAYMAFFGAGFPAQKMALLPKSTPAPIVAAFAQAFADALQDPELIARKSDVLGEYPQATGAKADRLFEIATVISPEAKQWMREYLTRNYNVAF